MRIQIQMDITPKQLREIAEQMERQMAEAKVGDDRTVKEWTCLSPPYCQFSVLIQHPD